MLLRGGKITFPPLGAFASLKTRNKTSSSPLPVRAGCRRGARTRHPSSLRAARRSGWRPRNSERRWRPTPWTWTPLESWAVRNVRKWLWFEKLCLLFSFSLFLNNFTEIYTERQRKLITSSERHPLKSIVAKFIMDTDKLYSLCLHLLHVWKTPRFAWLCQKGENNDEISKVRVFF